MVCTPPMALPIVLDKPMTPPTPVGQLVQQQVRAAPAYKLSRDVYTIPDLWKMWTEGLGGMPSVQELDAQWGHRWRQNAAERQHYSMRKRLIDEIKARAARNGGNYKAVVQDMERKRVIAKASIDKVIKALKGVKNIGQIVI